MMKKLQICSIILLLLMTGILSGCSNQQQLPAAENKNPTVTISANPTGGLKPLNVSFFAYGNDSDGVITSYHWIFGDGNTSDEQNPTHIFDSEGIYIVKVNVTDNNGTTGEDTLRITVFGVNVTLDPTDDATFYSSMGKAIGDSDYLSVELSNENVITLCALKFNLSDIPIDRIIQRATLRLYCWDMPYNTSLVKIHQSTNISWEEDAASLNWTSRPSYSSDSSDDVWVGSYGWYEWDVTKYVQNALSSRKITLVLDTDSANGLISFYSKESSYNPPQLIVMLQ